MYFYTYVVKWYFETEITCDSGIVIGSDYDEAMKNIMESYDNIDSVTLNSLNWDFKNILPLPNSFIKSVIEQAEKATNEGCGPMEFS